MLAIKAMNEVELESVVVVVGSEALRLDLSRSRIVLEEASQRIPRIIRIKLIIIPV